MKETLSQSSKRTRLLESNIESSGQSSSSSRSSRSSRSSSVSHTSSSSNSGGLTNSKPKCHKCFSLWKFRHSSRSRYRKAGRCCKGFALNSLGSSKSSTCSCSERAVGHNFWKKDTKDSSEGRSCVSLGCFIEEINNKNKLKHHNGRKRSRHEKDSTNFLCTIVHDSRCNAHLNSSLMNQEAKDLNRIYYRPEKGKRLSHRKHHCSCHHYCESDARVKVCNCKSDDPWLKESSNYYAGHIRSWWTDRASKQLPCKNVIHKQETKCKELRRTDEACQKGNLFDHETGGNRSELIVLDDSDDHSFQTEDGSVDMMDCAQQNNVDCKEVASAPFKQGLDESIENVVLGTAAKSGCDEGRQPRTASEILVNTTEAFLYIETGCDEGMPPSSTSERLVNATEASLHIETENENCALGTDMEPECHEGWLCSLGQRTSEKLEGTNGKSPLVKTNIGKADKFKDGDTVLEVQSQRPELLQDKVQILKEFALKNGLTGFRARKKRTIDPNLLPTAEPAEVHHCSDGDSSIQKAFPNRTVMAYPRMWDSSMLCDLCHRGPSLMLGEWYSWCCGMRLFSCGCSLKLQVKLKSKLWSKKTSKLRKSEKIDWSGVVHRMCALWSGEVFEGEGDKLHGVWEAVKRGKSLTCSECREVGATLGCRVKSCRRSFHYPCADKLASQLRCRMWEGVQFPIACHQHLYVSEECLNAKSKQPDLKEWKFRGSIARRRLNQRLESLYKEESALGSAPFCQKERRETRDISAHGSYSMPLDSMAQCDHEKEKSENSNVVIELSSDSQEEIEMEDISEECPLRACKSRHKDLMCDLYYIGKNLICQDISGGREAVLIPCTNDVDSESVPDLKYITESRYLGKAKFILESLLSDEGKLARCCKGCNTVDTDDPYEEVSVHVNLKEGQRNADTRIDWQGQPMFGRIPYDIYSRLQVGPAINIVIECNSRCPCGWNCKNRELQKGLQIALEVFKTHEYWSVRTMERIPRGKFVVELVGEFMSYDDARKSGPTTLLMNFRYPLHGNQPAACPEGQLVLNVSHMSNVASLINHSNEANLRVYRVYTETTDDRFFRLGMYAARDIEIGEELSYDHCIAVPAKI